MVAQASTWPIPERLQAEILRVLGYPDRLSSASIQLDYPNFASSMATWQPYAVLIQKLTFLQSSPDEAVPIFGSLHPLFSTYYVPGQAQFVVDTPTAIANGAKLTANVDGTAVFVTAAGDTPTTLSAKLVTALLANATIAALVNAASAVDPSVDATAAAITFTSMSAGMQGNGLTLILASSDPTLTVAPATSTYASALPTPVATMVLSGGMDPPGPSIPIDSVSFPVYGYLPCILQLESDLGYSRRNLSAIQSADVTLRSTELAERDALLHRYKRELADRLGVPINPDIIGNRRRRVTRRV